jgi:hypothetical protein
MTTPVSQCGSQSSTLGGKCCGPATTKPVSTSPANPAGLADDKEIVAAVNDFYSDIARKGARADHASAVAKAFGYTEEELAAVPDESHMGLSCGNPTATASLKSVSKLFLCLLLLISF